MAQRRITVNDITRIEGHANLVIEIEGDALVDLKFGIHEGSRYFESFMLNRPYKFVPEISGRICGICTVAHMISSALAVENALGIDPGGYVHSIRKLMLFSSHIQSHILHLYFLALPDYLGVGSSVELASKNPELVKKAFKIKEATNEMTALLGGRAVHPPAIVPGGHTKRITRRMLEEYRRRMGEIYPLLVETAEMFLSLDYPDFERDTEFLALVGENIPLYQGMLGSTMGTWPPEEYREHIEEFVVEHSSAKHSLLDGRDYMVGALARLNLNDGMREEAREIAEAHAYRFPSRNVAWINAAQAIENIHFSLGAMELASEMGEYEPRIVKGRDSGEGVGVIEAPRGVLIHHYSFYRSRTSHVNIITPTAMNAENIERTLRDVISQIVFEEDEVIKKTAEKLIRSYDPCISCSVHVTRIE